ncbi:aminotransferase class IV [Pelagicoccus sp. SDUM812002]|uniref:aminotransferase class IV n=1 Tax=Pelagicoccus sp. SDUM812002 TaxID=3041266 RepID=UPI00280D6F8E|nr:aminotransferase class IV [Pelagicoccus sp. SDUM812002]MDQ8186461.1 aminotransferase class IV [Pelagicoccus sp. SDUM812002]
MGKLFLNGELVDGGSVTQSLLSRGFAFGFGVFETMKFLDKSPCFFGEHLQRLRKGLDGAGLAVSIDETSLRTQAKRLFEVEGVSEGVFKIVISDDGERPLVAMFIRSKGASIEPEPSRLVMSAVVKASQAFTSRNKSLNYMESVLELDRAKSAGFSECVFRNELGELTECAVANLFFVQEGILKTPALDCGLLNGIVRRKVIEISRSLGMTFEEGRFTEEDLLAASEVFLTSSGAGPCSAESFQSSSGQRVRYSQSLLPGLRESFLKLEREEGLSGHD